MVWINPREKIATVLTIAGLDPSGGAGIAADLKTIAAIGLHGALVITTLTAQNTKGVYKVKSVDPEFVRAQIRSVLDDLMIKAIKIGVLYSTENIKVIGEEIKGLRVPVVLDPVLKSTTGQKLISEDAVDYLINKLFPLTTLVTPNKNEAEKLTNIKIDSIETGEKAAKELIKYGSEAVLIKGGHMEGPYSIDILYHKDEYYYFKSPRIKSDEIHGTGCSLSAAIASFLALGYSMVDAISSAKELIYEGIKNALKISHGNRIINPFSRLYRDSERFRVLSALWEAFKELKKIAMFPNLVPETRMNFVYSLPSPLSVMDVAGFPGRITTDGEEIFVFSRPWFGASKHVANIVLTANRFDPTIRSAINIRFSRELIRAAEKAGFKIGKFSRKDEPKKIKEKEGMTLSWGVERVIEQLGFVPDIIFDEGDVGKEPMIRILARNPAEIINKIKLILKNLRNMDQNVPSTSR